MRLSEVFPKAEIQVLIPDAGFRDLSIKELSVFADEHADTMIAFGLATWDHALSCGVHGDLDPQALADPINAGDPWLIRHVEEALGRRALLDFHYTEARRAGAIEPFASISLAHLYPNHLHVGDVLLLDPRKPRHDSPWIDQKFESLRLFGTVLDRLKAAANALGADKLSLTAAHRPLRSAFERHGFRMADTMGAQFVKSWGVDHSFPMELTLA